MEVFVARQAVFDRQRRVYGYELLFRSGMSNVYDGTDPSTSTTSLMSSSLLAIGLDKLIGKKRAFVNFGRDMLLSGLPTFLPKARTIIEVLETVTPEPDVLAACEKLRRQGYVLALDDFVAHSQQEEFLRFAWLVKVEMHALSLEEHQRLVSAYHARGLRMLAEKVETEEEFLQAKGAGYDYFQGYFFARPVIVSGHQIPTLKLNCLRLMREVVQPELDFGRLTELITADVGLTYKLLRYANSCLFSGGGEIHTVEQALLFPGEENVRRWVVLAAMPGMAADKPPELLTLSLERASMCESLARLSGIAAPGEAFLMGLFSLLDTLLSRPMSEVLDELKVSPAISDVLSGRAPQSDGLRAINELVARYEVAEWDEVSELASRLGVAQSPSAASIFKPLIGQNRLCIPSEAASSSDPEDVAGEVSRPSKSLRERFRERRTRLERQESRVDPQLDGTP